MAISLPLGYRFHPTDVELVCYLKKKIKDISFHSGDISEVELYKFAPWDLPEQSSRKGKDLLWFFFCMGEKKYSNGSRKNRATEVGYWKTTGKDKPIKYNSRTVAFRKTLVFHEGKAQVTRTDWVMHEYRLADSKLDAGIDQDAYVLCKIYEKSGRGPKIGEQYGPLPMENDWEDEELVDFLLSPPIVEENFNGSQEPYPSNSNLVNISEVSDQITSNESLVPGSRVPDAFGDHETSSQFSGQNPLHGFPVHGAHEPDQLLYRFGPFSQVPDQLPLDESLSPIELEVRPLYSWASIGEDYIEISDLWGSSPGF